MTVNAITIARTLGAGGEEVGRAVAERMGYRYVDDDIISLAAQRAGIDAGEMARVERRRSLVDRILLALAMGGPTPFDVGAYATLGLDGARHVTSGAHPGDGGLEAMIVDVVAELAAEGRVVVVAHGGGRVLRTTKSVLRCLITAPPDVRACRVPGGREAVCASDKARREFFRRFFNDSEHHDDYDVVINTHRLTVAAASEMVVDLAHATPSTPNWS